MIVKAEVIGSSSSDPRGEGRVTLRSTGYWEESLRIPVVGNVGLNSGDIVFVDVSCGVDSPLVLGRCRDGVYRASLDVPMSGSVLWDVRHSDDSWSMAYVDGDSLVIANSSGSIVRVGGSGITVHGGRNGGMVNVDLLRDFINAVVLDLTAARSNINVLKWLRGDGLQRLEDSTFKH